MRKHNNYKPNTTFNGVKFLTTLLSLPFSESENLLQ